MKYALIVSGVVKQTQPSKGAAGEWKECGANVVSGYLYSGSEFTIPPIKPAEPPTVAEQIAELESSVTARWLRCAALGDTYAIGKIQEVEDKIKELRP